jgi:hypothetical protein
MPSFDAKAATCLRLDSANDSRQRTGAGRMPSRFERQFPRGAAENQ